MAQDISLEKLLNKISSASPEDCSIEGNSIKIKRILGSFYEVIFRQYTPLLTNEPGYMIEITNCEYTSPAAPRSCLTFIGKDFSTSDYERMRRSFNALKARIEEDNKRRDEEFLQKRQRSLRDDLKDLLDE